MTDPLSRMLAEHPELRELESRCAAMLRHPSAPAPSTVNLMCRRDRHMACPGHTGPGQVTGNCTCQCHQPMSWFDRTIVGLCVLLLCAIVVIPFAVWLAP